MRRENLYAEGHMVDSTEASLGDDVLSPGWWGGYRKTYYSQDRLGSTRMRRDDYTFSTCDYDAFGNCYRGGMGEGYGYNGKPVDAFTGLYNYGFRDYSPRQMRFTTADPIKDGLNWYAYVGNDPVNRIDPNGLWVNFLIGGALGFGTSAFQEVILNKDKDKSWGTAIKETFTPGESLAAIVSATAIGALTSGGAALGTKVAIGATRMGGILTTSTAKTIKEVIIKTVVINTAAAFTGAAANDITTRKIKGQEQDPMATLSNASSSALFAAGTTALSQGIIGYNSATISDVKLVPRTTPSSSKVAMPIWSAGLGAAMDNFPQVFKSLYNTISNNSSGIDFKENN